MIVDRVENGIMVIEMDGGYIEIPHSLNPEIREGDVVYLGIDARRTAERQEKVKKKLDKLFKRG